MSFSIPNCQMTFSPAARGEMLPSMGMSVGVFRWPTDSIGLFVLTLTNVIVGSRIHIETQGDGTALHDSLAESTTVEITLAAYGPSSPYNDLRIKIRKGTGSPTYRPFETLTTAIVGSQSIYIGQLADE